MCVFLSLIHVSSAVHSLGSCMSYIVVQFFKSKVYTFVCVTFFQFILFWLIYFKRIPPASFFFTYCDFSGYLFWLFIWVLFNVICDFPSPPAGPDFLVPVAGFLCRLCHKFYHSDSVARLTHCKSLMHFENFQVRPFLACFPHPATCPV